MEIRWQPLASKRFEEVINYQLEIAGERSAFQLAEAIYSTVEKLLIFPQMGKIELSMEDDSYRSIVAHKHYKIIYYIKNEVIHIFTIWDCRRDPNLMKEERFSE